MTDQIRITIPRAYSKADGKGKAYTVYEIEVSVGRTTWAAAKRYSAFHALMQLIKLQFGLGRLPAFPKKKVGRNSAGLVEARRVALQHFLGAASGVPVALNVKVIKCRYSYKRAQIYTRS